jgi:hypothetical protein
VVVRVVAGVRPFVANGVTLGAVVATYFETLPLCGLAVAILRPWLWRSRPGAALLGGLAAIPFYCGIALTIPKSFPMPVMLLVGSLLAFVIGGAIGASIWRDDHATPPTDKP